MIWGCLLHVWIPHQVLFDVAVVEHEEAVPNTACVGEHRVVAPSHQWQNGWDHAVCRHKVNPEDYGVFGQVVRNGYDGHARVIPDTYRVTRPPCCPGGHHEKQTGGGQPIIWLHYPFTAPAIKMEKADRDEWTQCMDACHVVATRGSGSHANIE